MWRISTPDGRIAWFCDDDRESLEVMIAELFGPAEDVTIERAGEGEGA